MSEIKLKPCPFCGRKAMEVENWKIKGGILYGVRCVHCHAVTGYYEDEKDAFKAWNQRAEPENSNAIEDVAPVIHAYWTRKRTLSHDGELYCSNCEWTPEVLGSTTLGDLQLADVYHCPHCGAKMDGGE